jgi:hypothetical protein
MLLVAMSPQAQDISDDNTQHQRSEVHGMAGTRSIEPIVGDWYHSHGLLFEVVAIDDAGRSIEVQHADGDLEEIDVDDWSTRCRAKSLRMAEPPEDPALVSDCTDGDDVGIVPSSLDEINGLHAEALGDLDLFE